jgi:hypothetical protein
MAPDELFGDHPNRVGTGTVNDVTNRTAYEVDVVAFGPDDDNRRPLIAIGEAKWGETMGVGRAVAAPWRPCAASRLRMRRSRSRWCYSGAGFDDDLRNAAEGAGDVVLIGLSDLYRMA